MVKLMVDGQIDGTLTLRGEGGGTLFGILAPGWGLGFRVWGLSLRFGVWGLGCRVSGLGFRDADGPTASNTGGDAI